MQRSRRKTRAKRIRRCLRRYDLDSIDLERELLSKSLSVRNVRGRSARSLSISLQYYEPTLSNTNTGTLTKFRGRCRRVAPKERPELPNRTMSCTSIGSEYFGDAAMIWSALHTFNTSPQIKDKELKELFPIVVISAFGFQDFLDSLANVGTPPSNLIHEIHMALLHPLLRQHINNQIAALKRKDSEATVPKWITSSCGLL